MKQLKNMRSLLMLVVFVVAVHSFEMERMDLGPEFMERSFFSARATEDWCGLTKLEKTLSVGSSQLFGSPGYPSLNYPTHTTCRYSFKTVEGAKLRLSCANLTLDWYTTLSFTDGEMTKTRGCPQCCGDFSFTHDFTAKSTEVTFRSCFMDGPAFQCKMEAIDPTTVNPTTTAYTTTTVKPMTTAYTTTTVKPMTTAYTTTAVNPTTTATVNPTTTTTTKPTTNKCKCGQSSGTKIVGGTEVTPYKYGWLASFQWLPSNTHACGGALISPSFVLTAAHCTVDETITSIRLALGDHDLTDAGAHEIYPKVIKIIDHPKYNDGTLNYDYSLIQIAPVNLTANPKITPVCLPQASQSFVGKDATVAGWGYTTQGGTESSVLLEVKEKVVTQALCRQSYSTGQITDQMLCSGGVLGEGSCQGDSGGPLMVQATSGAWEVIGVTSWGTGCAQKDFYGVYADVSNQLAWINENINKYETCVPAF